MVSEDYWQMIQSGSGTAGASPRKCELGCYLNEKLKVSMETKKRGRIFLNAQGLVVHDRNSFMDERKESKPAELCKRQEEIV